MGTAMRRRLMWVTLFWFGCVTEALPGVVFNFTEGTNLAALQGTDPTKYNNFVNGFMAAGQLWQDRFTDDVTINIRMEVDGTLGPTTLGGASNVTGGAFYADVRNALTLDATSATDLTAVANLQATSIDFLSHDRSGTTVRSNGSDAWSNVLDVARANLKALGLISPSASGLDSSITFNEDFNFDFDRSDGISGFDFIGIAAHEIGHALGFVSGVDVIDILSGASGRAGEDINGADPGIGELEDFRIFTPLDLFRYSADSLAESGQPALGSLLDLRPDGTPFFSTDGGATNEGLFSTGAFNGDGRQASHWKDNLNLGLLDPTFAPGEFGDITPLDVRAFDVIGWDLASSAAVPEPATNVVLAVFAVGMLYRRRRKS